LQRICKNEAEICQSFLATSLTLIKVRTEIVLLIVSVKESNGSPEDLREENELLRRHAPNKRLQRLQDLQCQWQTLAWALRHYLKNKNKNKKQNRKLVDPNEG
jgi:hypothetical protein